jgi:pimeloyl-ACP methyl ester carboxylesterase
LRCVTRARWHHAAIDARPANLFLPGFGARASAYAPGLPSDWTAIEPPRFPSADGLGFYLDWLGGELASRPGSVTLAGHSMGGALCTLAAGLWPERIRKIVLIGPAGLPLSKPMYRSAAQFGAQVVSGHFSVSECVRSLRLVGASPASAFRLAVALRTLDLSAQMRALRDAATAATVIGCTTDTLVTPWHTRRSAELLGARYHEIPVDGGHMWMFGRWERFRHELVRAAA